MDERNVMVLAQELHRRKYPRENHSRCKASHDEVRAATHVLESDWLARLLAETRPALEAGAMRNAIESMLDEEIHRDGPLDAAWLTTWVMDIVTPALAAAPSREGECPDCGHVHTPAGCSGPPTPSDLWAGAPVAACDCDAAPSREGES